jgi:hypothetical protein
MPAQPHVWVGGREGQKSVLDGPRVLKRHRAVEFSQERRDGTLVMSGGQPAQRLSASVVVHVVQSSDKRLPHLRVVAVELRPQPERRPVAYTSVRVERQLDERLQRAPPRPPRARCARRAVPRREQRAAAPRPGHPSPRPAERGWRRRASGVQPQGCRRVESRHEAPPLSTVGGLSQRALDGVPGTLHETDDALPPARGTDWSGATSTKGPQQRTFQWAILGSNQ